MSISNERLREMEANWRREWPTWGETRAGEVADAFTELLAARDALAALTKERDEAHASRDDYAKRLHDTRNLLMCRIEDWRDAFAMPDEPDAEAIERTRSALAATEGKR